MRYADAGALGPTTHAGAAVIPTAEWLDKAKRLAVGMHIRVQHLNERRHNMVIAHESDRYWCYCQACKDGSVVVKEHVKLLDAPPESSECKNKSLPTDLVLAMHPDYRDQVGHFLARKHMDFSFFDGAALYLSPSRKRLVIRDPLSNTWVGRDLTDRSMAKWLVFDGEYRSDSDATYLGDTLPPSGTVAVVVEDALSYFKVKHALDPVSTANVYCALGTTVHDKLALTLRGASVVIIMFDGDTAGYRGAMLGALKLRGLGLKVYQYCAPQGLDPKDMQLRDIVEHIQFVRRGYDAA